MGTDGFALFTECHRLYIQGVRRAIRERLEAAYGDSWWERGVLPALTEDQRRILDIALEREPTTNLSTLLDAPHFGRIVLRNQAAAFGQAFRDVDATISHFRFLTVVRNEWAHIPAEGLPWARVAAAIQAMKELLLQLRCREVLEIEEMSNDKPRLSEDSSSEDASDNEDSSNGDELAAGHLGLWQELQSYLALDLFVGRSVDVNGPTVVTVRVSNVAPASEGRPEVYFSSVHLEVLSHQGQRGTDLSSLAPGQSIEREFTFDSKELATVEFQVHGSVDPDRLFRIPRKAGLPVEVVRPILKKFADRFEAIRIWEPVQKVLASIAGVQPNMTLSDASSVRKELEHIHPIIEEKASALQSLFNEFQINNQSALGAQREEVSLFLNELGSRIRAIDNAIGETDSSLIEEAASDLEQLQISVLQLEETIRSLAST